MRPHSVPIAHPQHPHSVPEACPYAPSASTTCKPGSSQGRRSWSVTTRPEPFGNPHVLGEGATKKFINFRRANYFVFLCAPPPRRVKHPPERFLAGCRRW